MNAEAETNDQAAIHVSVVIATHRKPEQLGNALKSICAQEPPFAFEVIVVDDGSGSEANRSKCSPYDVRFHYLDGSGEYRNPGIARNVGYRLARGEIVIAQSDDVVHGGADTIERLAQVEPGTFNIATVHNAAFENGAMVRTLEPYTSKDYSRPLFFLGSLRRRDVYAIGGNCEEFTRPGYEDDWFAKCLICGLGLQPVFRDDVLGFHQDHPRPPLDDHYRAMRELFERKMHAAESREAPWHNEPWPFP